jgi:cytosine/adenosine deaminase-related metal-dependent hydrolase
MGPTVGQVFNLGATGPVTGGARASGMAGDVGQIKTGAKVDRAIFGMTSSPKLAAAQEDPAAAIVLHFQRARC